jgi:hypothetical protein
VPLNAAFGPPIQYPSMIIKYLISQITTYTYMYTKYAYFNITTRVVSSTTYYPWAIVFSNFFRNSLICHLLSIHSS